MHKFKQLKVYDRAIDLGYEVRKMLKRFPKEEMFKLLDEEIAMLVGLQKSLDR